MPVMKNLANTAIRVLVTGSRGKTSVVRLLHAALQAAGVEVRARTSGVEPRELGPNSGRAILRSSGAHVEEMRWWLKRLPRSTGAVVLENSAVTPELQALAGEWLQPNLTIFTNAVPDHQEAWGRHPGAAAEALAPGVPENGPVVLPESLMEDKRLTGLLRRRGCRILFAPPFEGAGSKVKAVNLGLALEAARFLRFDSQEGLAAMTALPEDRYGFRLARHGDAEIALAFSANDLSSTQTLFESLGWDRADTRLVYNHRMDRPGRLRAFAGWMDPAEWREALIVGDRPPLGLSKVPYTKAGAGRRLADLLQAGERYFGCGNIAGLPLNMY